MYYRQNLCLELETEMKEIVCMLQKLRGILSNWPFRKQLQNSVISTI